MRSPRSWAALAAAVVSSCALAPAFAQPSPADTAPALSPPRLVAFVPATRPASDRAADVELILALDATGAVTDVTVAKPAGDGFDEAAVAAARQFGFEPARQGDRAVPSRIRDVYHLDSHPEIAAAPDVAPRPVTGRLEGRVLDRDNNEPLVGANVVVLDASGAQVGTVDTDGAGAFAFDALPPGAYRVRVLAFEYGGSDAVEDVALGEATSVTYRLSTAAPSSDGEFGATARVEAPAREITRRRLSGDELAKIAGTRGDALRAVELLPGVARPPAGNGMLIVRGSAPWDSGVYLSGIEVPRLYHFGGLTSFASSNLLESIDLYPGNFSVRYGRKVGGVIEVGLRDPRTDGIHGTADLNMIDTSMLVEGSLSKHVSMLVAARRSYLDFWLENVIPSDELAITTAPVYADYQAMVVWKPSAADRVRVIGYGSDDKLAIVLPEPDQTDPSVRGALAQRTGYHRGELQWRHRYNAAVSHDMTLTAGLFQFDFDIGQLVQQNVDGRAVYGRSEWQAQLAPRVRLTSGIDVSAEWADITYRGPRVTQFEGNPEAQQGAEGDLEMGVVEGRVEFMRPAAYAEVSVRPIDRLEVIGGVRTDYFGDTDEVAVDPRLVARYTLTPRTTLKAAVGRFSQPPQYGETMKGIGNPDLDATHAIHTDVGVEVQVNDRTQLAADTFYKDVSDLTVNTPDGSGIMNGGAGRIYGVELSARIAPGGPLSGFLSYTLSRSERNDDGSRWRLFDIDQTHILAASGMWKFGRGWTTGATFRLTSGNPSTPVMGSVYDANADRYRPMYGAVNSGRNPTFHQLDLRIEKRWAWGHGNSLATYLDLQNAYNARHVEGVQFNYDYSKSVNQYGLPVLPSLGLRLEM